MPGGILPGVQVIEIPDTAPRGQQVASRVPLSDPVAVEYAERGLLAGDAQVLAVSSPLDSGSGAGVGALPFSTRTVTADTTARPGELLEVDATAGEVVVTPPASPAPGTYLTVLKVDDTSNRVLWSGAVNTDPDGAAIVSAQAAATFVFDGVGWVVESVNTSYNVSTVSVLDATTTVKGKAKLLGGTADAPTVPYSAVTGAPTSLPPSGGAGGVLSGTFPNPGFAVDMATQAELDAVATTVGQKAAKSANLSDLASPSTARTNLGAAPIPATTVNPLTGWLHVTGFGATGNGTTDDSAAITSAVAALTGGQTLYFAPGSYRFAQQNPTSTAAIGLSGKSNVGIVFAPGAELLMDNLDGSGHGTSHGVAVYGGCADIRLEGIRVRWASTPSTRSLGDGFRFLGYPSDSAPAAGWTGSTGTIRNLQLINCTSQKAPQTGSIFMGCSDVRVLNFRAQDTLADGLHFNACRNVMVAGHQAINCGDDGLAFVTYYHATNLWEDAAQGPFAFSDLGGWSNFMTNATGVVIRDGAANGCRISGSLHVTVTGLSVESKANAGLVVDSARAGGGIVWDYQASRAVSVSNLTVHDCGLGIRVAAQNINSSHDSRLWTFGARITGATLRNNTNWAVRVEGDGSTSSVVAGLELSALKITTGSGGGGNGAVGLSSLRDSFIGDIYMDTANAADFAFFGQDTANTGALSTLPRHNVTIGVVQNTGGRVFLQDLNGVILGSVRSRNSPQDGFILNGCANVEVGTVRVEHPNRTNNSLARAVMLNKTVRCTVRNVYVETDSNNQTSFRSLEIGGGDATNIAASGLRIGDFTYTNTLNQTGNDIVQQGGPYAPAQYQVTAYWYNGGEASPVWRAAKVGDFPVPA